MVVRPSHMSAYEYTVVCGLRAKQLLAGCTPRLAGDHNAAAMAQMEVAGGYVARKQDVTGDAEPGPAGAV